MVGEKESLVKSQETAKSAAGFGVLTAVLFIFGELAGVGILTLPNALNYAGWTGLVLIVTNCFATGVSCVALARSWVILEERYPSEIHSQIIRKPFQKIGEKAFGKWMSSLISIAINLGMSGTCCVLLIVASQNVESFVKHAGINVSFCFLLVVFAVLLIPVLWLGSPKDFWPIAVGAAATTAVACILIVVRMLGVISSNSETAKQSTPTAGTFALAFGSIAFAFGGIAVFPTVQRDMKSSLQFEKAIVLGFLALLVPYLSVAATGYLAFGEDVETNIIQTLPAGSIRLVIEMLMTMHCLCAFVIVLNPVANDVDDLAGLQQGFSWKRCFTRTSLVLVILFVCLTFPHLGAFVDLIGGSVHSFLNFVAPGLLYLRLTSMKGDWPDRSIPLHVKVLVIEIMIVGTVGGIIATYSTLMAIANQALFSRPCYV